VGGGGTLKGSRPGKRAGWTERSNRLPKTREERKGGIEDKAGSMVIRREQNRARTINGEKITGFLLGLFGKKKHGRQKWWKEGRGGRDAPRK